MNINFCISPVYLLYNPCKVVIMSRSTKAERELSPTITAFIQCLLNIILINYL